MPGLAIGSVIQVIFRQRIASQRVLTVLHAVVEVAAPAGDIPSEMQDAATWLAGTAAGRPLADWIQAVTPSVKFDEVRVQPVAPLRLAYQAAAIGSEGAYAGTTSMPNLCMSLTKRTDFAGQKFSGRIQMAGIPDGTYSAGLFNGTYLALVADKMSWAAGTFTVSASGATYRWCLWHGVGSGTPPTPVFAIQPQPEVRTMHRRTVGLGI